MSKIDPKFIVNLKGKEFVTYEGLLDLAHQKGLIGISTELLQVPVKENDFLAIVKATATTKDLKFEGIGDCDDKSANSMISVHKIRMAETRAKARALRDLTNVGMTAMEELSGDDDATPTTKKYKPNVKQGSLSDAQIQRLYAIAGSKKVNPGTVKKHVKAKFNKDIAELNKVEYDTVCKGYEGMKE